VRVLGNRLHTPTQFFWEYPPGYQDIVGLAGEETAEREGLLL